jgi:S1-C subfamily serine protease
MNEELTHTIVGICNQNGRIVGTGFAVTMNLIATCAHVATQAGANPGGRLALRWHTNGAEANATALAECWRAANREDIAILQLDGPLPPGVNPLPLASAQGSSGHTVLAFGYPDLGDLAGLWGKGEVIGPVHQAGIALLQLRSVEITSGFSGGPLWDTTTQRVIGMITATAATDSLGRLAETCFATPTEALLAACPRLAISPPAAPPALSAVERTGLERTLKMARRSLAILEEQAAGFGNLNAPAHLLIQLEDQREKVADLERRIGA